MLKRSQAHTRAKASFSVWLYRRSTSDRRREAYPIARHSLPCSWVKTAPSPTGDASTTILVLLFTLKYAKASACEISSFNFSNATCYSLPHLNSTFLWVNLWMGSAMDDISGTNLDTNWARPRRDLASLTFCGGPACLIAATLSSLGSIPVRVTSCPKNVNLGYLNSRLSSFSVRPVSFNRSSKAKSLLLCCSSPRP